MTLIMWQCKKEEFSFQFHIIYPVNGLLMQMLVMVLSYCCCFFCCLSVLEVIKGHYQHAAHAGLRLTSADFLLYFNSISRNKRHGYGSLGSSLSPLLFINGVLHSGSAIEPDSLKVIQHFSIRGQQMDFSLHCNETKVRFFQTDRVALKRDEGEMRGWRIGICFRTSFLYSPNNSKGSSSLVILGIHTHTVVHMHKMSPESEKAVFSFCFCVFTFQLLGGREEHISCLM